MAYIPNVRLISDVGLKGHLRAARFEGRCTAEMSLLCDMDNVRALFRQLQIEKIF